MPTKIYLVRHGQTEYNKQKRVMGVIDSPLTAEGRLNAEKVADKLKTKHIDEIFSSDLGRALHTAYIITRRLNIDRPIMIRQELRERSFGDYAGLPISEYEEKEKSSGNITDYCPPNGESLGNAQKRLVEFALSIAREFPDKILLYVAHDSMINAYRTYVGKIDFGSYHIGHFNSHEYLGYIIIDNGEIIEFKDC